MKREPQNAIGIVLLLGVIAFVIIAGLRTASANPAHVAVEMAQRAPALSMPVVECDEWRSSATVDGGAGGDVMDEADGGINTDWQRTMNSIHITNDNAVCAHVGGDGVDVNTGFELGTGAGCTDGPSVSIDGRPYLEGVSAGAAVLLRVKVCK